MERPTVAEEGQGMLEPIAAAAQAHQPAATPQHYPPSWLDRLQAWITARPGPPGLIYLGVALVFALVEVAVKWLTGSYAAGPALLASHAVLGAYGVLLLGLIHYLDHQAAQAIAAFRPVLAAEPADYERWRYQLTHLPAGPARLVTLVSVPLSLLLELLLIGTGVNHVLQILDSGPSLVPDGLFFLIAGVGSLLLVYHTLRQLVLVSRIQAAHSGLSLFEREPAHAFSALTARTAIGLILLNSITFATLPNAVLLNRYDLVSAFTAVGNVLTAGVLGAAVFVLPLLGMYRVLRAQKRQQLEEVSQLLEHTLAEINQRLRAGDLEGLDRLKMALDTLVVQRDLLSKVSPWPWRAETANGVIGALLLPLLIWALQRILATFF
jgi:hypothetical protein